MEKTRDTPRNGFLSVVEDFARADLRHGELFCMAKRWNIYVQITKVCRDHNKNSIDTQSEGSSGSQGYTDDGTTHRDPVAKSSQTRK
jgi:phage terminase small subunit